MTHSQIINILKNEVLETYPSDGINIVIPSESDYSYQLTTTENELQTLNNSTLNDNYMSIINLKDCESLIKEVYHISDDIPLIILKFEKITNVASEKNVQYEIYSPITYEKIDLEICSDKNSDIEVNIPIEFDEDIEKLYNSLKKEGYDLFDINNKFYMDICSPFTAENGADVLLDDRLIYFYSKIVNIITCPKNCFYTKFSFNAKSLSCQCNVNNDIIDIENMDKLKGYPNYNPSLNGYKYTSYKTMKCHKLVFSSTHFSKNAGSILVLIFFIVHIVFLIYYIIKDIASLKLEISKIVFEENKVFTEDKNTLNPILTFIEKNYNKNRKKIDSKNFKAINKSSSKGNKTIKESKKNLLNPPKISRANKARINSAEKKKDDTENLKLVEILKQKKKQGKHRDLRNRKTLKPIGKRASNKKIDIEVESLKSDKVRKRKSIIDYEKEREIKIRKSQVNIFFENSNNQMINANNKPQETKTAPKRNIKNNKNEKRIKKPEKILDDYELNHLPYDEALELDKRSFCKIYWSLLKRDELLIFTFFNWNDYNLFHIKIERFLIVILTLMTMNGFLFSDKSIHKLFLNGVEYDFGQQILQIILSVIITHVFEVLLCFLSLTDNYIYKIKTLSKEDDIGDKIFLVIKGMKIKLIIFFVLIFIISAFYWYFISAFCAVYKNTQGIYIIDCVISFLFYLVDPFIVYALFALLRVISLKNNNKKNLECLYKTSRLCPIF